MNLDVGSFSYEILAGRSPFDQYESVARKEIFTAWFNLWDAVYKAQGSDFRPKPDEFLRQDLITCIRYKGQPAAMHLYSFYDLNCAVTSGCHYFEFFNSDYMQKIKSRGVNVAMSMEYFTVVPEFRKSIVGVSLGAIVANLGTNVFRASGADVIIAPARKDLKVDQTAYAMGFECIQADTMQRGFPCDMIACFQGKQTPLEDFESRRLVSHLWSTVNVWPSATRYIVGHSEFSHNDPIRKIA